MRLSLGLSGGRLDGGSLNDGLLGFFLFNSLHHDRGSRFGLLGLDDEVTQDGVVETEAVFDFSQGGIGALDVHQNIVSLDELLDRVGELATAPVLDAVNLTALFENEGLVTFDHRADLFGLIGVHDDAQFVMTH